jgi:hypothetical protein
MKINIIFFQKSVNVDHKVMVTLWHVGSPFQEASRTSASGICFSWQPLLGEYNWMKLIKIQ